MVGGVFHYHISEKMTQKYTVISYSMITDGGPELPHYFDIPVYWIRKYSQFYPQELCLSPNYGVKKKVRTMFTWSYW